MQQERLEKKTVSAIIWKLFERFGSQIISFVINIILARILLPEDYGVIALLTVFIAIATVFVQGGFSSALVRKIDADELDFSSVFYFSFLVSILLYVVIFFTAPLIADFYEMPILTNVLRVLAIVVVIGSYNSVQMTILSRNLQFKRLFISSFSSVLVAGVIGVIMALKGYGVWALVAQQLMGTIITTVVMQFTVKWHPRLMFSIKRIKKLFSFGWKLLLSSIIDVVYNNMYSLIIGKKYSSEDLAFWNRGKQFPDLLINNVNGSIMSVMYPVFSKKQNEKDVLKGMVRRTIKLSAYLVFPMMMGMALCADPIIRLLLGEKWLFAVPYLQGWCFCYALMPIHTANLQVYNALGRSDVFFVLEIIKKVIGVIVLFVTLPFGLGWMMFGTIAMGILGGIINAFPNTRILKYSFREQIIDLLPTIFVTIIMGAVVYGCSLIPVHYVAVLVIQVIVGVIVYFGLSAILRQESFLYIWNFMKSIINGRKNKKQVVEVESNDESTTNTENNNMDSSDNVVENVQLEDEVIGKIDDNISRDNE